MNWLLCLLGLCLSLVSANSLAQSQSRTNFGSIPLGSVKFITSRGVGLKEICGSKLCYQSLIVNKIKVVGSSQIKIANDGCTGKDLRVFGKCRLRLSFAPIALGPESAQLVFSYNTFRADCAPDGTCKYFPVSGNYSVDLVGSGVPRYTIYPVNTNVSCKVKGNSSIDMTSLALNEDIPLVGTPFYLSYTSTRFQAASNFSPQDLGLGGWTPSILHFYEAGAGALYSGDGSFRTIQATPSDTSKSGYFLTNQAGTEVYYFNAFGLHLQTKDALTGVIKYQFTYDASGNISLITDQFGNSSQFQYSAGAVTLISPYGQSSTLNLDANGFLAAVTNPNNETYQLTSDPNGFLVSFQKPNGQKSHITYDSNGLVVKDQGAGGDIINLVQSLNPSSDVQTVISSTALDRQTTFQTTSAAGSSQQHVITPEGAIQNIRSEDQGTNVSVDPSGQTSSAVQGADPRFGWMAPFDQSSTYTVPSSFIHISSQVDKTAQLADSKDPLSLISLTTKITLQNDPARAFTSTYQSANHILTFQSPLHRITSETLNTNAQLASLQVGSLIPAHFSYDSRGRLISVSRGDRHSSLNYDAASNIASSTDFLGRVTQFQYDQAGRVILEILPDGDRIAMTYDSNGNMISLTPPGKTAHSFSYNLFELVGQYLPPSLNATISGATTYSYNLDKQLTQVNRPDGKQISFNYGVTSGLLNSIVTAEGIFNTTYGMNSSLVKSISSPDHVVMSYQYAGSLPLSVETTGPVLSSIHYDYSSDGSVSAIGVAGKNNSVSRVDLKYDKDGLLTGAGDEALSLNDVGSVSATVLGKVRESVGFDNLGQITSDEFFVSARSILKTQLTRDSLERITRLQKIFGKASKDISYQYDVQGRLTEVREGSRIITTYKYDANGNRIEVIHQGRSVSAKYDVQDRLISFGNTDYIYNASGERLAKTVSFKGRKKAQSFTTNYAYDSFGNLKSATLPNKKVINYILDGQNRRIGKKVNGSLVQGFVYQSQTQVAAELDSSGQMIKQFIYGSKENIPDYMIYQGKEYRIISNHVGTPEAVVEVVSGKTIEQLDFDEFGVLRSLSGKNLLPFGFAGGLLDQDTKLTHFGAREYDAESGRWLQKDPIRFQGGDTNLMSYVANDPINGIDPSGLKTIFLITRGALGIGNHIAVYIDNGGSPMIFDPGGTYATPLDGTGDLVSGARANTGAFAAFHQSHFGDSTEMITFDTSSADEAAIADRLQGPGMGGFRGGQCATGVSSAVDGIGPFKGLGSNFFFPGSVGRSLRALGGR